MNRDARLTTGLLVRGALRTLIDSGVVRDARVRVSRAGGCCRCRISSQMRDGSSIHVEAADVTRARAVDVAVQRLRDRVRERFGTTDQPMKEPGDDGHDPSERRACVRPVRRRRGGRRRDHGAWIIN